MISTSFVSTSCSSCVSSSFSKSLHNPDHFRHPSSFLRSRFPFTSTNHCFVRQISMGTSSSKSTAAGYNLIFFCINSMDVSNSYHLSRANKKFKVNALVGVLGYLNLLPGNSKPICFVLILRMEIIDSFGMYQWRTSSSMLARKPSPCHLEPGGPRWRRTSGRTSSR